MEQDLLKELEDLRAEISSLVSKYNALARKCELDLHIAIVTGVFEIDFCEDTSLVEDEDEFWYNSNRGC